MLKTKVFLFVFLILTTYPVVGSNLLIRSGNDRANGTESPYNQYQPGDTIWLEPGIRSNLLISDFHGSPSKPVVFANQGGRVEIRTETSYGIAFKNCSYFILQGVPGNGFEYGIWISHVGHSGGVGISVGNRSTDFTIRGCEISDIGFAGIVAKTEPECGNPATQRGGFTQYRTTINGCYIHDVGGEGLYIGSSFFLGQQISPCGTTVLPPVLEEADISYNRIERTGFDGMQISSVVRGCRIHHNILRDCSYLMSPSQRSGILIGGGTLADCCNNQVIDCYATGILLFGDGGSRVYNNLIIRPGKRFEPDNPELREHGIFISDKTLVNKTWYAIYHNTIIRPKSDGVRIDNTVDFETRLYNNIIIDPGAFDVYENDNTSRKGEDAYIFETASDRRYRGESNYFSRSLEFAGFSGPDQDNFRLRPGSFLIDLGKSLYQEGIFTDLDDRPRPAGITYDIGAYEYHPGLGSESLETSGRTGPTWKAVPGEGLIIYGDPDRVGGVSVRLLDLSGRILVDKVFKEEAGAGVFIPVRESGFFILQLRDSKGVQGGKVCLY